MLYFIAVWTLLLIVCCIVGTGCLHFLQATAFRRSSDRFIAAIWLGIVILAVALLLVSLVFPLSSLTGLLVAAAFCGLALRGQATRLELAALKACYTRTTLLLYLIGAILIAALTTRPVTWLDTGLYHYPLIQWLHQIGTVPGLPLLFANFGFTSSWFAFAAPLNPEFLASRASALTGGFVLFIALLQAGISLAGAWTNRIQFSDWFLGLFSVVILLCLLGSPHLLEVSVSPSPDVPVSVLTGIITWTILVISNASQASSTRLRQSDSSLVTLVLATAVITIKLTALPLLVIGCSFYLTRNYRSLSRLVDGLAVLALVVSPFLLTQIFTSGCPLFPSTALCLNLPWSVPIETQRSIVELTHDWTNWYSTAAGRVSLPVALLSWLNANRGNQIMALVAIMSFIMLGLLFKVLRQRSIRGGFWVIATQLVAMGFYLKTSPLLRFALPCLTLIPVWLISSYCHTQFRIDLLHRVIQPARSALPRWGVTWPGLGFWLAVALLVNTIISSGSVLRLVLPPRLQSAPLTQKQVNDITYLVPQNGDVCWGSELPCAFEITPDIYLRDPSRGIAAGFVRSS